MKTLGATHIADEFDLSGGEYRVLRGLMDLAGLRRLAEAVPLSEATVSSHASRIREKLGVGTVSEAVQRAVEVALEASFVLGKLDL